MPMSKLSLVSRILSLASRFYYKFFSKFQNIPVDLEQVYTDVSVF